MPLKWTYETALPGGMRHTIQVQPDRDDVDFNVIVRDREGSELARDDSADPGAVEEIETGEEDEKVFVTVELVRGSASFSLRLASQAAGASPAFKEAGPGDAPSALTDAERQTLVDAHNAWRRRYGTADVVWSDSLGAYAQAWADHLAAEGMALRHRSPNTFGENLFWAKGARRSVQDVVDAWGSEEKLYDHAENNWWPRAAHFSQLIWKSTREVGCGVARVGDQEIWVCNYDPRGNWSGELPY